MPNDSIALMAISYPTNVAASSRGNHVSHVQEKKHAFRRTGRERPGHGRSKALPEGLDSVGGYRLTEAVHKARVGAMGSRLEARLDGLWVSKRVSAGYLDQRDRVVLRTSGGIAIDHIATPAVPPASRTAPKLRSLGSEPAGVSAFLVTS